MNAKDMSDDNRQMTEARRRRIQRLKKCIIAVMLTAVVIPVILCTVLFVQIHRQNVSLRQLLYRLEELESVIEGQQDEIEKLSGEIAVTGQGNVWPETGSQSVGREENKPELLSSEEPETDSLQQKGEEASHKVYLTFDDGPSAYTDEILDILDEYQIKATFFVVGKEDDWAKEALQDIVDRGHTLGMHSYSHKYSEIYGSVESFSQDFTKIRDHLYEVTGVKSDVYRFPGGSSNTVSDMDMREFADYLEEENVRFFDWNISSGDGGKELLTVEALVENSTADIEKYGTSVILLHDSVNKRTTVEALPIIIENILAMEDTVILPITDETEPVQHIH